MRSVRLPVTRRATRCLERPIVAPVRMCRTTYGVWRWYRAAALGLGILLLSSCRRARPASSQPVPSGTSAVVRTDSTCDRRSFLLFNVWTVESSRVLRPWGIRVELGSGSDVKVIPPLVMNVFAVRLQGYLPNNGRYEVGSAGTLPIRVTVLNSVSYDARDSLATATVELPLRPFWSWVVSMEVAKSRPATGHGTFMSPVAAAIHVTGADSLYIMVGGESRGLPRHVH